MKATWLSKIVVVLNPKAGSQNALSYIKEARRALMGYRVEFHQPSNLASLGHLLENLPLDTKALVMVGGDGTMNCALPWLLKLQVPVYHFPLGTANDLARHLKLGPNYDQVQDLVTQNAYEAVDVISVNGSKYFSTVGGIGVGARLTSLFNERRTSSLVFGAACRFFRQHMYSVVAAGLLLGKRHFIHNVAVRSEGFNEDLKTGVLMVCNQPALAGDLQLVPQARNNDGKFNVFVVWARNRQMLLRSLMQIKLGKTPANAYQFETHRLTLTDLDQRPIPVFGDGEVLLESPEVEFSLLPKAVNLFSSRERVAEMQA